MAGLVIYRISTSSYRFGTRSTGLGYYFFPFESSSSTYFVSAMSWAIMWLIEDWRLGGAVC